MTSVTPSILPPSETPTRANLPACRFPAKAPTPDWLPAGLPLPANSYAMEELTVVQGLFRAYFVVPGSLRSFVTFIIAEWPKHGWHLGRGHAEEGEVDDTFSRPPAEFGAFKANEQLCTPGYVLLLLAYSPNRAASGSSGSVTTPLPATNTG